MHLCTSTRPRCHKNSSLVKMQPLAVLRSFQFQIQHSFPNELRPQILIPNSWLVCARINRRSLRVSLCTPFLYAVLSWSSTFLIACHSAFKLLRRGPCCESKRERERERRESCTRGRSTTLCTRATFARETTNARSRRDSRDEGHATPVCVYYVARRRNATERGVSWVIVGVRVSICFDSSYDTHPGHAIDRTKWMQKRTRGWRPVGVRKRESEREDYRAAVSVALVI